MAHARPYHPQYLGGLCLLDIYIPRGPIRSGTGPRREVRRVRPVGLRSVTVKANAVPDEKEMASQGPAAGGRRGGGLANGLKSRVWSPDS